MGTFATRKIRNRNRAFSILVSCKALIMDQNSHSNGYSMRWKSSTPRHISPPWGSLFLNAPTVDDFPQEVFALNSK